LRIVVLRTFPSFLILAATVGFGFCSISHAQDAGLESLKRQSLPWYDAASEQVKPVDLAARDEPQSQLRSTVVKKKPASKNSWLEDFFENIFGDWDGDWGNNLATFLYWLLWIALGIAVAILIIWAVQNLDIEPPNDRGENEPTRSRAQSVAQLPFQLDDGNDDFRTLASQAVKAGNYRQAIVWLFSHVLVSLDQHDLIRLKKGKTNRQYLRELAGNQKLSDYYADVMLPFEASFFGDKEIDRDEFDRCWRGLEPFEQQVKSAEVTK
jgi:hypothetical protein